MKPDTAFSQFQVVVNADPDQLATARSRRDAFVKVLGGEADVQEVVVGGSLRRGTQRAPISDVDVYAIFSSDEHPTWGASGTSASEALELVAERIAALLGKDGSQVHLLNEDGGTGTHVRLKGRRRHSVKCFIDDPDDDASFTVDVVPALRHSVRGLLIPEVDRGDIENGTWIRTDPEALVAMVAERQQAWPEWVRTVRMLKYWSEGAGTGMSSLYVEALALDALPVDGSRTEAIQRFFTTAEWSVTPQLQDPAGLCGAIQPDLDLEVARTCIAEAAKLSGKARTDEANEQDDDAVCAWRKLFGGEFPEPPRGCDGAGAKGRTVAGAAVAGAAGPAVITPKRRPVKQSPQG